MKTETALITGASSGIGLHLAYEFARNEHPLVLVDPIESELHEVAARVQREHGIKARVISKDLKEPNAAQEIFSELQRAQVEVEILVNNAGHGFKGHWWELPIEKDLSMLRLNVEAVLRLTKLFLPPMLRRGRGRIINTASMVGFEPVPLQNTYAATKAFVLSWSEALAAELKGTPISVTALCPGTSDSGCMGTGVAKPIHHLQGSSVMAPQEVAKIGYEALMRGEFLVVAGAGKKSGTTGSSGAEALLNGELKTNRTHKARRRDRIEREGLDQIFSHPRQAPLSVDVVRKLHAHFCRGR